MFDEKKKSSSDKKKKPSSSLDPFAMTSGWLLGTIPFLKRSWYEFISDIKSFFRHSTPVAKTEKSKPKSRPQPLKPHIQVMPDKQMLKLTFPTGQVINTQDLMKFINSVTPEDFIKPNVPNIVCPKCGWTLTQLMEKARLGCPECYETFKEFIAPTLGKYHAGSQHVGKKPKKLSEIMPLENQIASLEEKLKNAISEERYEDATVLRDQINLKKKELADLRSKKPPEDQ